MADQPSDDYFFRNRKAIRSAKRAKATRLLQDLFGPGNYSSTFTAFDPFFKFKFAKEDVAPVKRKRKMIVTQGFSRNRSRLIVSTDCSTPLIAVAPGVNAYGPFTCTSSQTTTNNSLAAQVPLLGFLNDTTLNTRPNDVYQGEMEMFFPKFTSSPRNIAWTQSETRGVGTTTFGNYSNASSSKRVSSCTSAARMSVAAVNAYLNQEKQNFADNAEDKAVAMLGQVLPSARRFDALREIGELRDLPRTLYDTVTGIKEIVGGRGTNVSSAYLNKEFGWDPIFNSLLQLVELPEKITNRVNYLITRSKGYLPTTLRSRHNYVESMSVAGTSTFDGVLDEIIDDTSHSAARLAEWRIAVNCLIRFPPMELPLLKEELKSRMYGLKFRVSDLWNLMPWTWLFDWFAGVGEYIDTVCAVNEDTSIINWGLLTYRSNGFVKGNQTGHVSSNFTYRQNADPIVSTTKQISTHASSSLEYLYTRRVDLATVSDVRRSWKMEQFSGFQLSILSALFFQNENFKGFGSKARKK